MNTTLYVSNLPLSMDSTALEDMFTLIGDVCSAKILRESENSVSLGRGVVEMSTRVEAENSVLHYHRQVVDGQMLIVRLGEVAVSPPSSFETVVRQPAFLKLQSRAKRVMKATK